MGNHNVGVDFEATRALREKEHHDLGKLLETHYDLYNPVCFGSFMF